MPQLVSFQSAKCCATNFDLRSKSIQRNVQAIQQLPMVLLSSTSRFRQIGFVSGKWKRIAPTHSTLLERKTSQQLFLEDWMLEKTTPSLHVLQRCPSTLLWGLEKQWSISLNMVGMDIYIYIFISIISIYRNEFFGNKSLPTEHAACGRIGCV